MLKKIVTWFPTILALILIGLSLAGFGQVELLFIILLALVQSAVLGLPMAAGWLGKKVGEKLNDGQ